MFPEPVRARNKIACISVAFNAAGLLPKQLEALRLQEQPLDEIIVVDNGSTDGTVQFLRDKYPQVTLIALPKNLGIGGALSEGMRYAFQEKRCDLVWLLDDDSVPAENVLAGLLHGLNSLNGTASKVGVLAPMPINGKTQLSYPGLLWRRGWVTPEATQTEAVSFVDAVISSGSLVSKAAVDACGLPRADFFMDFVDFEYCLRLRRQGFLIGVVHDSRMEHTIGAPRSVRFLWQERTWSDHAPWREYYMTRNQVFTIWTEYPDWKSKLSVVRRLLRHAAGIVLFGEKKFACLRMMTLGFVDGRAGRLGIRFVGNSANA